MGNSHENGNFGCQKCAKMKCAARCYNQCFLYPRSLKMFIPKFPYTTPHLNYFMTQFRRATCEKSHYCHTSSRSDSNVATANFMTLNVFKY